MSVRYSFLRHGESVGNAEGWLAGHIDAALTERGRQQAIAARDALLDVPFDRVLVSDLTRARHTLALALPDWDGPTTVSPRLRERTIGDWDGRPIAELRQAGLFEQVLVTWHGRPPGGESHADLARRVIAYLAETEGGGDTLVVCHGGLMRAVLTCLDARPTETAAQIRYPNCALQTRAVPPGRWAALARTI